MVLTDGLPTDSSPEAILARVRQINAGHAIAVSTVGVGGDQGRGFLDRLAAENGGAYVAYD